MCAACVFVLDEHTRPVYCFIAWTYNWKGRTSDVMIRLLDSSAQGAVKLNEIEWTPYIFSLHLQLGFLFGQQVHFLLLTLQILDGLLLGWEQDVWACPAHVPRVILRLI